MKLALKPVAIGEIAERSQTWNPSRSSAEEVFQYIDLSAVDQDAKVITGAREVLCGEAPSRARQLVESGDILVSTVRPNLNGVARVPEQLDGATASTGFCVLRADKTKANGAYLFHWVKSPAFVSDMVSKATGASYPAVSDRIIFDSQIPLPPLVEQKRIAAILDAADALRAKRREALAQLDALLQSTFLTLFGDPVTNPMGWPVRKIGEVTECLDRLRKAITASDRTEGNVPYYGANGLQGWIDRPIFNEPLVLVAEDGGHFENPKRGVAYRIDGPAWVNNHAHILRPLGDLLDLEYLHRALRHYDFTAYISGTTRAKLTQGQLNLAKILLPPLPLQQKFAAIVESVERQKAAQRAHLAELDALFAALQHRAFRGEL